MTAPIVFAHGSYQHQPTHKIYTCVHPHARSANAQFRITCFPATPPPARPSTRCATYSIWICLNKLARSWGWHPKCITLKLFCHFIDNTYSNQARWYMYKTWFIANKAKFVRYGADVCMCVCVSVCESVIYLARIYVSLEICALSSVFFLQQPIAAQPKREMRAGRKYRKFFPGFRTIFSLWKAVRDTGANRQNHLTSTSTSNAH